MDFINLSEKDEMMFDMEEKRHKSRNNLVIECQESDLNTKDYINSLCEFHEAFKSCIYKLMISLKDINFADIGVENRIKTKILQAIHTNYLKLEKSMKLFYISKGSMEIAIKKQFLSIANINNSKNKFFANIFTNMSDLQKKNLFIKDSTAQSNIDDLFSSFNIFEQHIEILFIQQKVISKNISEINELVNLLFDNIGEQKTKLLMTANQNFSINLKNIFVQNKALNYMNDKSMKLFRMLMNEIKHLDNCLHKFRFYIAQFNPNILDNYKNNIKDIDELKQRLLTVKVAIEKELENKKRMYENVSGFDRLTLKPSNIANLSVKQDILVNQLTTQKDKLYSMTEFIEQHATKNEKELNNLAFQIESVKLKDPKMLKKDIDLLQQQKYRMKNKKDYYKLMKLLREKQKEMFKEQEKAMIEEERNYLQQEVADDYSKLMRYSKNLKENMSNINSLIKDSKDYKYVNKNVIDTVAITQNLMKDVNTDNNNIQRGNINIDDVKNDITKLFQDESNKSLQSLTTSGMKMTGGGISSFKTINMTSFAFNDNNIEEYLDSIKKHIRTLYKDKIEEIENNPNLSVREKKIEKVKTDIVSIDILNKKLSEMKNYPMTIDFTSIFKNMENYKNEQFLTCLYNCIIVYTEKTNSFIMKISQKIVKFLQKGFGNNLQKIILLDSTKLRNSQNLIFNICEQIFKELLLDKFNNNYDFPNNNCITSNNIFEMVDQYKSCLIDNIESIKNYKLAIDIKTKIIECLSNKNQNPSIIKEIYDNSSEIFDLYFGIYDKNSSISDISNPKNINNISILSDSFQDNINKYGNPSSNMQFVESKITEMENIFIKNVEKHTIFNINRKTFDNSVKHYIYHLDKNNIDKIVKNLKPENFAVLKNKYNNNRISNLKNLENEIENLENEIKNEYEKLVPKNNTLLFSNEINNNELYKKISLLKLKKNTLLTEKISVLQQVSIFETSINNDIKLIVSKISETSELSNKTNQILYYKCNILLNCMKLNYIKELFKKQFKNQSIKNLYVDKNPINKKRYDLYSLCKIDEKTIESLYEIPIPTSTIPPSTSTTITVPRTIKQPSSFKSVSEKELEYDTERDLEQEYEYVTDEDIESSFEKKNI